jgi:NADH-quinone oxidoreductase subunit H
MAYPTPPSPNAIAPDSRPRPEPPLVRGVPLRVPLVPTPLSSLASKDFGSHSPPREGYGKWLVTSIVGWAAFAGVLLFVAWFLYVIVWAVKSFVMWFYPAVLRAAPGAGAALGEGIGNIVALILIVIMITATLLTMADRKWSALMQDRVGPNRARLPLPGLSERPLKGIPHIMADVLKMLFKEDFIPEGAAGNKVLFNAAPLLAFAPAFCLFAVVPVGPEITLWGKRIALQVAHLDWGILYVFALASLAVFGTALAGWTSNNKLALLGGLRASAQLVSYEVTLGLTLVGAFILYGTVRLDQMVAQQGPTEAMLRSALRTTGADASLVFGWLPGWGALFQPIGMVLFLVAAMAEIKRAPFDAPEGESEIIGYFLEYSGLKSGLFLIAEYAEIVVISGIVTAIFLGGYHIPWIEPQIAGAVGLTALAVLQVFAFLLKMLLIIWVQMLARWAFPRFRFDQIMRLGWKMMLPVSLANVVLSAGVWLWGGREGLAWMGIVEWIALIAFIAFSAQAKASAEPGSHSSTVAVH